MANAFITFDLDPRFDLDQADLRQRFLAAAAENHPDRFTDPLDQADAADRSAAINAAYQTLFDPESRANALLAHLGGPAPEADTSLPPTLLMEMMEVREELEQATADHDSAALARLHQWASSQRESRLTAVANLFAASPINGPAIRLELNALRYAQRMLEQMPN